MTIRRSRWSWTWKPTTRSTGPGSEWAEKYGPGLTDHPQAQLYLCKFSTTYSAAIPLFFPAIPFKQVTAIEHPVVVMSPGMAPQLCRGFSFPYNL
jgi:hypothetical protein